MLPRDRRAKVVLEERCEKANNEPQSFLSRNGFLKKGYVEEAAAQNFLVVCNLRGFFGPSIVSRNSVPSFFFCVQTCLHIPVL